MKRGKNVNGNKSPDRKKEKGNSDEVGPGKFSQGFWFELEDSVRILRFP